jgi:hypothetical protein
MEFRVSICRRVTKGDDEHCIVLLRDDVLVGFRYDTHKSVNEHRVCFLPEDSN